MMNNSQSLSNDSMLIPSYSNLLITTEEQDLINQRADEIKDLVRRTAQNLIDIGNKLQEVKLILGHGYFGKWLQTEFNWSLSTASKMMQASKQFKSVNFTDLNIALSAIYLLSAPSTPDSARAEALSRASEGESISYRLAKELVQRHKASSTIQSQQMDEKARDEKAREVNPNKSFKKGSNNDFQEDRYLLRVGDENSSLQALDFLGHELNSNAVGILKEFCFSTSMIQVTPFLEPKLFQDALAREWSRIRREKQQLSIMICIIDSLLDKKVEEPLSLREDIFQKQVWQVICKILDRPSDIFTYLEKGIFVLMLPSTEPEEASIVAQSIQEKVDNQNIGSNVEGFSSSQFRLNLSFFIQGLVPSQPLSAQMLFDELLFRGGSRANRDTVGQPSTNENGRDIDSSMLEPQTLTIQAVPS